jgi:hypothetical protein
MRPPGAATRRPRTAAATRRRAAPGTFPLALIGAWVLLGFYAIFRIAVSQSAAPHGPDAILGATRLMGVVGIPIAVLGIALAWIAFLREEPCPWMSIGAIAACLVLLIVSFMEVSGSLAAVLVDKLPGADVGRGQ